MILVPQFPPHRRRPSRSSDKFGGVGVSTGDDPRGHGAEDPGVARWRGEESWDEAIPAERLWVGPYKVPLFEFIVCRDSNGKMWTTVFDRFDFVLEVSDLMLADL